MSFADDELADVAVGLCFSCVVIDVLHDFVVRGVSSQVEGSTLLTARADFVQTTSLTIE
jgi:hypothetical protein